MERESLGIKEVDEMLLGGIPIDSIVGLSGPPGVGKSIFALHFLLEGARKGEKSVYINLEEPESNINNMIEQFEFSKEFLDFIKKGKIVIKCFNHLEYEKIYANLFEKIKDDKSIKRLVIDSFNGFFEYSDKGNEISSSREKISEAFISFRRKGLTTLLVLEGKLDRQNGIDSVISYLLDGIISLDFLELGVIERRIFIPKMRWTDQFKESKGYTIGKKGIEIEKA
jgi:circadian clock protein KaiC